MNKSLKYILILLIVGTIIGLIVYKYAMQPVEDISHKKADITTSFNALNALMTANDTIKLNQYTNKIIAVSGLIKDIQNEDTLITLTLGDTASINTVICQTDKRHLSDFTSASVSQQIKIKGVCAGFAADDMGLGSSLQLKNCVLDK